MAAMSRRAALLRSDGMVVDCVDGVSPVIFADVNAGNYYLVVKQRNHIPVMSSNMVTVSTTPPLYNFITGLTQYYGNDAKDFGNGIFGMYSGDANASGFINAVDRNLTKLNTGLTGYVMADVNLSGFVNAADRNITTQNTGKVTNVP
jgi:hypothetical protein